MKYNGVIQRKFALLDRQILELSTHLKDVTFSSFKDDWALRSMAERALQVMVEIVIDVAERIIALEGAGPAASAAEVMEKLVTLKVLQSTQPYVDMVRFRNRIVFEHVEVDPEITFDMAKNQIDRFRQFQNEINALKGDHQRV